MKKIYSLFYILIVSLPVGTVLAQTPQGTGASQGSSNPMRNLKIIGKALYGDAGATPLPIEVVIGNFVKIILGFVGIIFLILIIVGAVGWMTAGGNEDKVSKAKKQITNAVIGLTIVFAAYLTAYWITTFVEFAATNNVPPSTSTP